jgi:hypothetical protein
VARYLVLWHSNPAAIPLMPTDPSESLKMQERMFAVIDDLLKKGEIEEFGFFPDTSAGGPSGYIIGKGEATDMVRGAWSFFPFTISEIHEIIPWETGREITFALMKARVEAAKK